MKQRRIVALMLVIVAIASSIILFVALTEKPTSHKPAHYTYSIVNTYPHDKNAFTQGLVYDNDSLYEGTGLYGESTLRRVNLESGNILQLRALSEEYFGEGITIVNDRVIQLTWR